jgi:hypothetical protein
MDGAEWMYVFRFIISHGRVGGGIVEGSIVPEVPLSPPSADEAVWRELTPTVEPAVLCVFFELLP